MLQQWIVGVIVFIAFACAVWRFMPAGWRRRAAHRLASGGHKAGWVDAQRADRLAASLSRSPGCGGCARPAPNGSAESVGAEAIRSRRAG